MIQGKARLFFCIGMLALVAGTLWRIWKPESYSHFFVGVLLGVSVVFLIFAVIKQRRDRTGR